MADEAKRPLRVFLCHASGDKHPVRELYRRLVAEGADAWLDQEKIMPGQDWQLEIPRAVREADVVVICLSNKSITKEGYIQKEIRFALDSADEKPAGTIFLIPARLEDCAVPERFSRWQWVDLFEENGFARLLRSLKLRADRVGATIEPEGYESEEQEVEHRLDQLYTEGLAAFYTEDWERAYQRFQTILRERPTHKNAAEKLAQAERQRNVVKLYAQATEAYESEEWLAAIKALEELLEKSGDYKDAIQLLKDAKKQRQLRELYAEARRLHAAHKWQAVVRVFDQITGIDAAYPDPDGLLPSAQKEAAELKRLADLNDLYRQGVHQMDAGEWYEARDLLDQVHKVQTGFLDTEQLLRKVEDEIVRIEQLKKRNNQINTLYEQAHGLVRSKSWRMALDKIQEIQKLDGQFVDKEGVFETAKTELEHEEQVAQRQNELAAMYMEAVRLLKEGKYQEALDAWQEVKLMDPKYPDRQRVQSTASRKLTESGKLIRNKPRLIITKPIWAGLIGLIAIGLVTGIVLFNRGNQEIPPLLTVTSDVNIASVPTGTTAPSSTDTARPSTAVPTITVSTDRTLYDDFDNPAHDGKFNTALWSADVSVGEIVQENGSLTLHVDQDRDIGLNAIKTSKAAYPIFVESKMMLDPASQKDAAMSLDFGTSAGASQCIIYSSATGSDTQDVLCGSEYFGVKQRYFSVRITAGTWHLLRIEIYPDTLTFIYLMDGNKIGSYTPRSLDKFKDLSFSPRIHLNSGTDSTSSVSGFVDYVRTGLISFVWDFDNDIQGWGVDNLSHAISTPESLDGYLTFKSTGPDPYISSPHPLRINASATPVITIHMRCMQGQSSDWNIYFLTNKDSQGDEKKRESFFVRNSGTFETYNIVMSTNSAWQDIITEFRLDPPDRDVDVQCEVDYISVHEP